MIGKWSGEVLPICFYPRHRATYGAQSCRDQVSRGISGIPCVIPFFIRSIRGRSMRAYSGKSWRSSLSVSFVETERNYLWCGAYAPSSPVAYRHTERLDLFSLPLPASRAVSRFCFSSHRTVYKRISICSTAPHHRSNGTRFKFGRIVGKFAKIWLNGPQSGNTFFFFHVERECPPRAKRKFKNSEKRTEQKPPTRPRKIDNIFLFLEIDKIRPHFSKIRQHFLINSVKISQNLPKFSDVF